MGKGDGVRGTEMGGEGVNRNWRVVMSACRRDSSNTELSSRPSGTSPSRSCLFSCPPPRTLEREREMGREAGWEYKKGEGGRDNSKKAISDSNRRKTLR